MTKPIFEDSYDDESIVCPWCHSEWPECDPDSDDADLTCTECGKVFHVHTVRKPPTFDVHAVLPTPTTPTVTCSECSRQFQTTELVFGRLPAHTVSPMVRFACDGSLQPPTITPEV